MKKLLMYTTAILFAMTLSVSGNNSYAGWFGSDDDKKTESQKATPEVDSATPPAVESPAAPAASEKALPEGKIITLSGKIDESNQFVTDSGEAFRLADTERGMEVKALTGKKVEIKP